MRKGVMKPNQVYAITYRTRDLGYGVEEGTLPAAFWTGEIDTWGKYTIIVADGRAKMYLFADEILEVEPPILP